MVVLTYGSKYFFDRKRVAVFIPSRIRYSAIVSECDTSNTREREYPMLQLE